MILVKLICIDLDGTLLNDEKKISHKDKEAIETARRHGIYVTIFTGRNYYAAFPYLQELGIEIPVVFQNGALIATPSASEIFRMITLDSKIAAQTVELCKEYGLYPVVYESFFSKQDMIVEKNYQGAFENYFRFNQHRIKKIERLESLLHAVQEIAEVAVVGKDELIKALLLDLQNHTSEFTPVKNQNIDGETFMEIFGKNVGKEIALDFLLEFFDLELSQVAYIGDNYNDLKIMQRVGFPVAMANAPEDVKDVARFVTSSNNDSGVSLAIEKITGAV
ncbi:Cof-type HAD-IIB family hydrolase [Pseudothermotoga sp. U03pept]|uniref:Cof-type HAD-IIB family hydrolase n=1 Tax=Pseudothermotoga sp. U03pept TaxID=3447012 RepID=UPI003F0BE1FE